jgi:hypothetical protein
MGKDTSQNQIGLYGYEKGVNTFGLKEDGTAFFGAYDNGRISIDGTSSTIYGGMTRNANNSMTLILNAKNISESTNAISIKGSANSPLFSVNYKGELNAQSATIKGNITATTLTATESGKIAGFTINGSKLEGGSIECSYLKASSTGEIGGWVIGPNSLTSSAKEENGTPMVTLSSAGSITCNNLTANKSGTIAGWKIFGVSTIDSESGETTTKGYLKGDNISLDSSGGSIIFYAGSVCGYIGKLAGSNAGGETTNLGVRSYGSAGLLLETPLG